MGRRHGLGDVGAGPEVECRAMFASCILAQAQLQAPAEPMYVTSLEELAWFGILMAVTMAFHGVGMIFTLRVSTGFIHRFSTGKPFVVGMCSIVLASWMIVLTHLAEVVFWAAFFLWKDAMPNWSTSYYFALLDYTTLGSALNLPMRWRMLEGGVAIAGLLTFAWSTGVLLLLAGQLQESQLKKFEHRRQKGHAGQAGKPDAGAAPKA